MGSTGRLISDHAGASTPHNGEFDAFVAKLNAAGSALVYSTLLGGGLGRRQRSGDRRRRQRLSQGRPVRLVFPLHRVLTPSFRSARATASSPKLNPSGSASSFDVPARRRSAPSCGRCRQHLDHGYDGCRRFSIRWTVRHHSTVSDAFVTGLNRAARNALFDPLGGNNADNGRAIALDAAGNIYVTARRVERPPQVRWTEFSGDLLILWGDGFVAKINKAAVSPHRCRR